MPEDCNSNRVGITYSACVHAAGGGGWPPFTSFQCYEIWWSGACRVAPAAAAAHRRWRSGAFALKEKSIDDKINVGTEAIANIETFVWCAFWGDLRVGREKFGKVWTFVEKVTSRDSTGAIKSYQREMFFDVHQYESGARSQSNDFLIVVHGLRWNNLRQTMCTVHGCGRESNNVWRRILTW